MVQIKENFALWRDDSIIQPLCKVTHDFTTPGNTINNNNCDNNL